MASQQGENIVGTDADAVQSRIATKSVPEAVLALALQSAASAAEGLFRNLIEAVPDGLVIIDQDGHIMLVNHQVEVLFGYSRAELLDQSVELLVPERLVDVHAKHRARYHAAPRTRPMGTHFQLFGQRRDGSEFPVEISLSPFGVDDSPTVIATIRDVSERKQAEAALHQAERITAAAEAQFRKLVDAAPDAMVIADREGHVVLVNQQAEALFGYARDELIGQPVELLIPARLRTAHVQHRTRYAADPRPRPMGTTLDLFGRRKDGREIPVEVSLSPFAGADGELMVISSIRDITARKQAEMDQRQAEQRARTEAEARLRLLQTLLNELPSGICLVRGRDARLVLANRAIMGVWGASWLEGQPMEAFLATSGARVLDPHGQPLPPEQLTTLRAVTRGESVHQHQEIIRQPDETTLPVLVSAVPLDPRVLQWMLPSVEGGAEAAEPVALVMYQDITVLKETERIKDEFIAMATHELRNPMGIITGHAQMLTCRATWRRDSASVERRDEAVDAITQATARLLRLTDDLLDVTRLQAGRLELRQEPHDLVALVRRAMTRLQVTTRRHTLAFHTREEPLIVHIDVPRVEQVLTNLLNNAIKYSPNGGEIDVTLRARREQGMAEVMVHDQGIGIPADQQARIFGRFARAENARERHIEGTGLGLFLCRELVELHGGRIWFDSVEGQGSTFVIALPLACGLE